MYNNDYHNLQLLLLQNKINTHNMHIHDSAWLPSKEQDIVTSTFPVSVQLTSTETTLVLLKLQSNTKKGFRIIIIIIILITIIIATFYNNIILIFNAGNCTKP